MPTREDYLAEAQRRGLREKTFGTISPRPGFLERSLPAIGQTVGGLAGGPGGPVGVGVGATAGAVAGRAGQLFLRRSRGEEITPQEVGKNLVGEGAVTAAAETAFPVAGHFLKPVVRPAVEYVAKKAIRPSIENFLRFMTGITPENTRRLLERGPANILTRKLRSREKGIRVAEDFLRKAKKAHQVVNMEWNATVEPLRKLRTSVVEATPIRNAAQSAEQEFVGAGGPVLEHVKDVFSTLHGAVSDVEQLTTKPHFAAQTREVTSPILQQGGNPFTRQVTERVETGRIPARKLSLDKAIRARQQLDDVVYAGKAQGLLTPRQSAALKGVRRAISDSIHSAFPDIAQVDEQRHILGQASKVIERFSPESVTNVDRLGRMIDSFEDISPAVREAIQKADSVIAQKTGTSLLDTIRDRAASKAFEPTELRAVRTWIITAALGAFGLGTGGPLGGAAGTALGITLSSPRLAGEALKGVATLGHGAGVFARKVAPVATAEVGRRLFLDKNVNDHSVRSQ